MCIFAPKVGMKMCLPSTKVGMKMCIYVYAQKHFNA